MAPAPILVVNDDQSVRADMAQTLRASGWEVVETDVAGLAERLAAGQYSLVASAPEALTELSGAAAYARLAAYNLTLLSDASAAAIAASYARALHQESAATLTCLFLADDQSVVEVVGAAPVSAALLAAFGARLVATLSAAATPHVIALDDAARITGEASAEIVATLRAQGWGRLIALPLAVEGRRTGAAICLGTEPMLRTTPATLGLLGILAQRASAAIENARRYQQALTESLTDPRTGLPNARYLEEHLPVMVAQAQRSGRPLSLVFIDSDTLKQVNDRFGHASGDRFIKELADIVKGRIRARGQGVRRSDVVVRYTGGDEFIVVMPDTGVHQAALVAERLRSSVSRLPFRFGDETLHCTISLGIAIYPDDADSAAELIRFADEAMYVAKRLGKDRVVVHSSLAAPAAEPIGAAAQSVPSATAR